jgi:hypothetical protein
VPYRVTLFDDQDGTQAFQGAFDTPEEAGRAAMLSQVEQMERGRELWPSVHRVDEAGNRSALDMEETNAFRAGISRGMDELTRL